MATDIKIEIQDAVTALQQGQLIAYPTEAVYGLGCDPKQPEAIEHLIKLKKRNPEKGLILIASKFEQLSPYLEEIDELLSSRAKQSWPGAVTWVWPLKKDIDISPLLTGCFQSIAVRVTNHPIAAALCDAFKGAIVSTSANLEGCEPAKNSEQVKQFFPGKDKIAKIINGEVGTLVKPTPIYNVITQEEIR